MGCYRTSTIVSLVLITFFASANIYKLFTQSTDEHIKRFLCHHHKHDAHRDMLDKQRRHQKHVLSHTIEKKEESFEERVKHSTEDKEKEDNYHHEISKEKLCRKKITASQMEGFHILAKIGKIVPICSLVSALIAFMAVLNDHVKNRRFRHALIPFISVHVAIVPYEIFAALFTYQLAHKFLTIHVILLVVSIIVNIMFTAIVSVYYRLLSQSPPTDGCPVKEEFDYAIMPEEKDASEA